MPIWSSFFFSADYRKEVPYREIGLEEILEARDEQVKRRQDFLRPGFAYLDFNLNIPGPQKRSPLLDYFFEGSQRYIEERLIKSPFQIVSEFSLARSSGLYICWELDYKRGLNTNIARDRLAQDVKEFAMELENEVPAFRLWDLDVFDGEGQKQSRQNSRTCLICGQEAFACARSRTHGLQELIQKTRELLFNFYLDQYGNKLKALAYESIVREVELTPKPGLVDKNNSGAHSDMDLVSFYRSAKALLNYFPQYIATAKAHLMKIISQQKIEGTFEARSQEDLSKFTCELFDQQTLHDLFLTLQAVGYEGEKAALEVNHGVNCHNGLNYALALILPAGIIDLGRKLFELEGTAIINLPQARDISTVAAQIVKVSFENWRVQNIEGKPGGARAMAASAYDLVINSALPFLDEQRQAYYASTRIDNTVASEQVDMDAADYVYLKTLLYLISNNKDSNVLRRGGTEGLEYTQGQAKHILDDLEGSYKLKALQRHLLCLDQKLIEKNLSPGGSADLLALTIFFDLLENS